MDILKNRHILAILPFRVCVHNGPLRGWWGSEINPWSSSPTGQDSWVTSPWRKRCLWAPMRSSAWRVDTAYSHQQWERQACVFVVRTFDNSLFLSLVTHVLPAPSQLCLWKLTGRHLTAESFPSHSALEGPLWETCIAWDWESVYLAPDRIRLLFNSGNIIFNIFSVLELPPGARCLEFYENPSRYGFQLGSRWLTLLPSSSCLSSQDSKTHTHRITKGRKCRHHMFPQKVQKEELRNARWPCYLSVRAGEMQSTSKPEPVSFEQEGENVTNIVFLNDCSHFRQWGGAFYFKFPVASHTDSSAELEISTWRQETVLVTSLALAGSLESRGFLVFVYHQALWCWHGPRWRESPHDLKPKD